MEATESAGPLSPPSFDLTGEVAIITGAARGIGRAVTETLALSGAMILALDLEAPRTVGGPDANATIIHRKADISKPAEIDQALEFCLQELGPPDILVHVAGISTPCPVAKMTVDNWQQNIDVNLQPVFYLSKAVLPHMTGRGGGKMVFFSSMIASTGGETSAHYTAAKGGVEGYCRSLAREVGPSGIRVNIVAPGMIDTAMLDLMPDTQKQSLSRRIPLRRIGLPEDLAGAVLFLVSNASAYITGQILHVNGGMYLG